MSAKFPRGGGEPILSHPSIRKERAYHGKIFFFLIKFLQEIPFEVMLFVIVVSLYDIFYKI